MPDIQLTCPTCSTAFEFKSEEVNVFNLGKKERKENAAAQKAKWVYRTCPKGHIHKYEVNE